MKKLRWGVLGCAKIAVEKVIPPLQDAELCEVTAIASRDLSRAQATAGKLGIARAHGSYEALLADREIDVVYNPLPNHLHVEWTTKAAEAGKHVVCEKPIDMTSKGAEELIRVRDRTGMRIQEAFMVRTHPQWLKTRELVQGGAIGQLISVYGHFSYMLLDPANIRNVEAYGGGGLLDIGCYPITTTRFVTGLEPGRVAAMIERDAKLAVDTLGSVLMECGKVPAIFTYSTQMVPHQTMQFFGTEGRLEVEIPFNAPNHRPCRLFLDKGPLWRDEIETIDVPTCDQYRVMGDAFARALMDETPQPVPLEDTLANMKVIDAVFRAGASRQWESV